MISERTSHGGLFQGLWTLLFALAFCGVRAQSGEVVEAVVVYGDQKLIDDEEALTDEKLSYMLDSLCTL
ncbi:MAG: hypothetical protein KA791_10280, partial [Flavobacteriales bacterium]|nr:hypothetical protein [Flavobacteriales bacterium]